MNRSIGGYFELELRKGEHYHAKALRLNTARNCLEYILRQRGYAHVYLPDYTCNALLEPLDKLHVAYDFYPVNEQLAPAVLPELKQNGAFLYTNYFGLTQACVISLAERYGERLIVDDSQAFFAQPVEGIDTFYSARKFFGVPDGAYLYTSASVLDGLTQDVSWQRASHLLMRVDESAEAGFAAYQANNATLRNQDIHCMSNLTEALLGGIDYADAAQHRRNNYRLLSEALSSSNRLQLVLPDDAVPMAYPYWTTKRELRRQLQENKIYTAVYWQCVKQWTRVDDIACQMADMLIPVPCDQRYGAEDMERIIRTIHAYE